MHSPLDDVRRTATFVCANAKHVHIDSPSVDTYASILVASFAENNKPPEWDEDGWHYCADVAQQGPLTCQYIFVLDALNFCFWPTEGLEYEQLAVGLKHILSNDNAAFHPRRLVAATADDLKTWIGTEYEWPQLEERVERIHELGRGLIAFCEEHGASLDESAAEFVAAAKGSATRLVELLLRYFPGFRDTAVYDGRLVFLYKRVQILVADLWAAYGRTSDGKFGFNDIAQLTTFPDYRVPQLLRHFGIMVYSEDLAAKVDGKVEIPFGSPEEVEIRAFTIHAVEVLKDAIVRIGKQSNVLPAVELTSVELDWLLWQQGEKMMSRGELKPHHRTLTIFY